MPLLDLELYYSYADLHTFSIFTSKFLALNLLIILEKMTISIFNL